MSRTGGTLVRTGEWSGAFVLPGQWGEGRGTVDPRFVFGPEWKFQNGGGRLSSNKNECACGPLGRATMVSDPSRRKIVLPKVVGV